MTDVRNSGYKAAAQAGLGTELNSLANATWSALSGEMDNSTNGYMFADFEFAMASITPTGADAAVELYLVPSVDDTQFPTYTESGAAEEQENNQYFVGSVTLSLDAEVHIHTLRGIELPPGKWKIGVRNQSNVALAASGSTVKWRPWQYSSV
jgi:hypothetical protein